MWTAAGVKRFGVDAELVQAALDEPPGVGLVVDRELARVAEPRRLGAQDPRARGVERHHPHRRGCARPSSSSTRSRISCAALLVNVIARISPGRARARCGSARRCGGSARASCPSRRRRARAAARSRASTASRWGSLRPSRRARRGARRRSASGIAAMVVTTGRRRVRFRARWASATTSARRCAAVAARRAVRAHRPRRARRAFSRRPARPSSTRSATTSRARPRGRRALPAGARRDQLRLRLVPALRKRPGCSGYFTVAWGWPTASAPAAPWSSRRAAGDDAPSEIADDPRPGPDHELMALFAQALRELGPVPRRRATRSTSIDAAGGSAERARRAPGRRDATVRRPRLLQARADRRQRPRARRRRAVRPTSTA